MRRLIPINIDMFPIGNGNVLKRSIIISAGKESNSDSVSNGERKRNRSNRIPPERAGKCGVWTHAGLRRGN